MTVPVADQKCENCAFYLAKDAGEGRCREVSPRTVDWTAGTPRGVFPVMHASAWCGSWKARE